jgi:hypothetical protein
VLVSVEPVKETFQGKTVWGEGTVHVFDLEGHPRATRAYAWSHLVGETGERRRFFAVLHLAAYARRSTRCGRLSWRKTRGGDKMKLGLFLTTLIGVAGASHISSAADATWAAVSALENGTSPYCAGGQFTRQAEALGQNEWEVDIKGNTLTFTSRTSNRSFTLDLKALQPDGSGKVVGKDDKNREFYLTFDPGSGARPFLVTSSINACRTVFTPKS